MELLDQDLQTNSQLSLTDYEILDVLSLSDGERLRMSDLARQVLVSRSRLTYRMDRLAEVDYVAREECEDDRRGLWAILTPTGRDALERAAERHHQAIQRVFLAGLSEQESIMVGDVLERLNEKLSAER